MHKRPNTGGFKKPFAVNQMTLSQTWNPRPDVMTIKQTLKRLDEITAKDREKQPRRDMGFFSGIDSVALRSTRRANALLKNSPYQLSNDSKINKKGQAGGQKSERSDSCSQKQGETSSFIGGKASATTACTSQNTISSQICSQQSTATKTKNVKSRTDTKLGKRVAEVATDLLELQTDLEKLNIETITLRDKVSSAEKRFSVVKERDLLKLSKSLNDVTKQIDMSKLEVEYDYETDQEQARQSRDYLYRDFSYAIEFFVKENPMVLVENLKL